MKIRLIDSGVSESEKQLILHEHNRLRQKVALGQLYNQPQAANLQVLRWDYELANVAQNWANNCYYFHNPNRHIGRFLVGENIARIWSSEVPVSSWQYIIGRWFSEYQIYIFNYSAYTAATGHYTQVMLLSYSKLYYLI